MPSTPGYKRNYGQEYKTAEKRGEVSSGSGGENALRHKARRALEKKGMVKKNDGQDVDHITPLSKGGSGAITNTRVQSAHNNRSYPRTSKGAIKKT